jgi:hypothetical protein
MTDEDRARMKVVEDIFKNGLANLMEAHDSLKLSITFLKKKEHVEGLAQFEHYVNHLLECHRIMAAEWERRWGSLNLSGNRQDSIL